MKNNEEQETAVVAVVLPAEVSELASKVPVNKKAEVESVLKKIFSSTTEWEAQVEQINVKDIGDKLSMELAETARKTTKAVRLEYEKIFDNKREEVQQKMVDFKTEDALWLKSKQIMQITLKAIEEKAAYKANFAKRYQEEVLDKLKEKRFEELKAVNVDGTFYALDTMPEEQYSQLLNNSRVAFDKAKEDQEKAQKEEKEKAEAAQLKQNTYNERKVELAKLSNFYGTFEFEKHCKLKLNEDSTKVEFEEIIHVCSSLKEAFDKKQEEIKAENERLLKAEEDRKQRNKQRNEELRPYIIFIRDYNALLDADEKGYKEQFDEIKIGAQQHWEYERKKQEEQAKKEQLQLERETMLKPYFPMADKMDLAAYSQETFDDLYNKSKTKFEADQEAQKREQEQRQREEADAKAGDKVKLSRYAEQIILPAIPQLKSAKAKKILEIFNTCLKEATEEFYQQIETLK